MKHAWIVGGIVTSLAIQGLFAMPALAEVYAAPLYQVSPYSSCPGLSYNLYRGLFDYQSGGQVSALQQFLADRYGADAQMVTGYFGPQTQGNVARFQQEMAVYPITGGVGPLTRAAIAGLCSHGGTPIPPAADIVYLDQPVTLRVGKQATEYQGQLDVSLGQINLSSLWWWSQTPASAHITLGLRCVPGTYCFYYPYQSYDLASGQSATFHGYTVTVVSLTAQTATILVSKNTSCAGCMSGMSISSPTPGQSYAHGSTVPVTWSAPGSAAGAVVLDLYTVAGNKVGTIAVQTGAASGSYAWAVPTPGGFCTLQYPNGLCGASLSGEYYIQVSLVAGSGLDTSSVSMSARSGSFSIY